MENSSRVFLEVLEVKLNEMVLSLKDFLAWHSTCHYVRNYLERDGGLLGKYANHFYKNSLERNRFLLETKKDSLYLENAKAYLSLVKLSDVVESIMETIVFNDSCLIKKYIASCTL